MSWKLMIAGSAFALVLAGAGLSLQSHVAWAGGNGEDMDGDTVADDVDNCKWTANTNQNDADGDGRGDACECGDFTGEGNVTITDSKLIQRCSTGEFGCVSLADVTGEGNVTITDSKIVQRFSTGEFGKEALTCCELVDGCGLL